MNNRLKELREENKYYQKDIAKLLGITQRNYSYLETGDTKINSDMLIKLSNIYKVNIEYILKETDIKKKLPSIKEATYE